MNEVAFRGNSSLPDHIKELSTPADIFCYFFSKELVGIVVEKTNRCALNQDINTRFAVNIDDIYHYIGIHLYMSIYRYPKSKATGVKTHFHPSATKCQQNDSMQSSSFIRLGMKLNE